MGGKHATNLELLKRLDYVVLRQRKRCIVYCICILTASMNI